MEPVDSEVSSEMVRMPRDLTIRDVRMFQFIQEFGFARRRSLYDKFWSGRNVSNFDDRIRKLLKRNWLAPVRGDAGAILAFSLSGKCTKWLRGQGLEVATPIPHRARYRTDFDHSEMLNEVYRLLQTSPVVSNLQPERLVRQDMAHRYGYKEREADGYKVPDALFDLENSKGEPVKVALELELSIKSKKRYRELVRRMDQSLHVDFLLFILGNDTQVRTFRRIWAEQTANDAFTKWWTARHSVYFTCFRELQKNGLAARFEGADGSFSLASLAVSRRRTDGEWRDRGHLDGHLAEVTRASNDGGDEGTLTTRSHARRRPRPSSARRLLQI